MTKLKSKPEGYSTVDLGTQSAHISSFTIKEHNSETYKIVLNIYVDYQEPQYGYFIKDEIILQSGNNETIYLANSNLSDVIQSIARQDINFRIDIKEYTNPKELLNYLKNRNFKIHLICADTDNGQPYFIIEYV